MLLLVGAAAFWPILNNGFIEYDDDLYVTQNRHVQAGPTGDTLKWAFTTTEGANWHPLTWISHALDCRFFGLNPKGHHLTNLLFHLANTLLLFVALSSMTGSLWRSAFVAALFAVHPLHVESVAWVAERKDVLSTLFWILTLAAYNHYVRQPSTARYLLVVLTFVMGLMAKPMLVTLPLVLLLLDFWPLRRMSQPRLQTAGVTESPAKLVAEKLPLCCISIASSIITYLAQRKEGAVGSLEQLPLSERFGNALVSYVQYIQKAVWPSRLAVFYPHPASSLPIWQVAGSFLLLAAITALVFYSARRQPYLVTGWFWFLGTLVPVLGLIQVGQQAMADRYTYVPLIGLFIAVAWGVPELLAEFRQRKLLLGIAAVLVVLALATVTHVQAGYWRDTLMLFDHAIQVVPSNYLAHNNLGVVLHRLGYLDAAISEFSASLRIKPGYRLARDNYAKAHYNLGVVLALEGKVDQAIVHYSEALRIEPRYSKAHLQLGEAMAKQGRMDEAWKEYEILKTLDPRLASDLRNKIGR
ncbi:MAG TPA: tetratricopeptide repeat protein [Acidobacteriota bacterium]|nr:tetratricopeptide repeat protein [Acidobacteriota bacterium]